MTKGERIRKLREKAGLKPVELASRIEVSKQTLYKYENDIITNIPSDKIELLAKVLLTTPQYIMGWEGKPTQSNIMDIYNKLNEEAQKEALNYITYLASKPENLNTGEISSLFVS